MAIRLSALGDVLLAQSALADLRDSETTPDLTWIIDERFRSIAEAVPGVHVLPIAKPRSAVDYVGLWRRLRRERFDTLLAMQANFRVNLLYPLVRAGRKIGFDARRARDLHGAFVNERIQRRDEHLLDGFRQFAAAAGAKSSEVPRWPETPPAPAVVEWWRQQRPKHAYVAVHMGASKLERCWPADRYGELAREFTSNPHLGVVLTGGSSPQEHAAARAFARECVRALDLVGQTDLPKLRLVLREALALVSPDTAAVHLARADDVPVVGLYAIARPELSGPYRQLHYTVNRYPEAVERLARRDPASVDWHFRVHHPEAMNLITATDVWTNLQRALFERSQSRDL